MPDRRKPFLKVPDFSWIFWWLYCFFSNLNLVNNWKLVKCTCMSVLNTFLYRLRQYMISCEKHILMIANFSLIFQTFRGTVHFKWQRKTSNWRYVFDPPTHPPMKTSSVVLHLEKVYISLQHKVKGLLLKHTNPPIKSIWRFALSPGYGRLP